MCGLGSQRTASVRVHLPLKQGLRPLKYLSSYILICASASSIKTRIKTQRYCRIKHCPYYVRVHLPLKQGLRRILSIWANNLPFTVRVYLPLKQGLRHTTLSVRSNIEADVRVHLPLKQGLRLHFP